MAPQPATTVHARQVPSLTADTERTAVTQTQANDQILEVVQPALAQTGLDVEGVEISAAGRRRVVRVLVDKDGGVTLDEIAAATTLIGDLLDDSDVLGDRPYTLEVTSPGTDRPLTQPRHWRRNRDRLVAVTLREGSLTGRILEVDDDGAVLDVDGTPTRVPYADVAKARVELEFNRPRSAQEA